MEHLFLRRFPKLDRVPFRIMNTSERAILRHAIPFLLLFDGDSLAFQFFHHGLEVRDPEIQHPLLVHSEIVSIFLERLEHGRSSLLLPEHFLHVYAEDIDIPRLERLRVF